jgi:hypothetical protein
VGPISALEAYHAIVNFNNNLAKDHPRVDIQRRALARLAVMFSQAARLRTVWRLVSQQIGLGTNTVIDPSIKEKNNRLVSNMYICPILPEKAPSSTGH